MGMLSAEEIATLASAESLFPSPIPVQSVSSDEFMPAPQTPRQREFEARVKDDGHAHGQAPGDEPAALLPDRGRHGGGLRRDERHLRPAVRRVARRGRDAGAADERARKLAGQFIMDMHTHFLRRTRGS